VFKTPMLIIVERTKTLYVDFRESKNNSCQR